MFHDIRSSYYKTLTSIEKQECSQKVDTENEFWFRAIKSLRLSTKGHQNISFEFYMLSGGVVSRLFSYTD